MDVYLPADFCKLRDELPDWRDAPPCERNGAETSLRESPYHDAPATCADPDWCVI
jgi:hypothetical protein